MKHGAWRNLRPPITIKFQRKISGRAISALTHALTSRWPQAIDVSIRLGQLTDSSATARLIINIPRVIIAAPAYLERAGYPAKPSDLSDHRIVGGPATRVPNAWQFERGGKLERITVAAHLDQRARSNLMDFAIGSALLVLAAVRKIAQGEGRKARRRRKLEQ